MRQRPRHIYTSVRTPEGVVRRLLSPVQKVVAILMIVAVIIVVVDLA
ncbi:MAG: hypothetical protein WKF42_03380 [Solirubrobacteraceae bacterium]